MRDELTKGGLLQATSGDVEQDVWDFVVNHQSNRCKRGRCNLNRFLGSLDCAEKALPFWSYDCWERTFLAIEHDMIKSNKMATIMIKAGPAEDIKEGKNSTSSAKLGFEDRALKASKANAIVTSVAVLTNFDHKRCVQTVVHCCRFMKAWHQEQNKSLRSAEGTAKWVQDQVTGSWMQHIKDGMEYVLSPMALVELAFKCSKIPDSMLNDQVMVEDDFAELAGNFTLLLAFF